MVPELVGKDDDGHARQRGCLFQLVCKAVPSDPLYSAFVAISSQRKFGNHDQTSEYEVAVIWMRQ